MTPPPPATPSSPDPSAPDSSGASASMLLIRHGESLWNAERRWQGQQDPALSKRGVAQARAAAQVLGTFDVIAASTLERAMTTASIIAVELGIGPVVGEPDLIERYAGAWEGLTRDEIEERYPGFLAAERRPDDYEPDESLVARAAGALGRVAARAAGGTALVVAHGGVIHALERATGAKRDGRLPNLGGRWFTVGPGRLDPGEIVDLAGAGTADNLE